MAKCRDLCGGARGHGAHDPFAGAGAGGGAGADAYRVPRLWPGQTIVCLAGGPSLTADDVAHCRGRARVIAINDGYRLAPWADVLYACDAKWWKWHHGVPGFVGMKFALDRAAGEWSDVQVLQNTGDDGLELDPAGLRTGRNSGYQAINLALHLGAETIVLLGYDMQAKNAKTSHWFGAHPDGQVSPYAQFLPFFERLPARLAKLGVSIVNCSRETALTAFQRRDLREVLL